MKKPNLTKLFRNLKDGADKHAPEILTSIGIGGMITTTIMAVSATPKAILILNEEECRRSKNEAEPKISKKEVVKLTWKCYVPSALVGGMSVACLIGASAVSAKRNAAIATAYTLAESALKTYQEKVIETIGEKKEESIRDAVAKYQIERNPPTSQNIIITNRGETLCYDTISARYFKIDIDKIRRIENDLYTQINNDGYVALNDFYYELGLEGISVGYDLGWNVDDGRMEIYFTSQLTPDDTPCLVLNYRVAPKYDYSKRR